jgi:acyl dehydratase
VDYARKTRWGKAIAHPTFMLYMGVPEPHEYTEDEIARGAGRGDPLAGVHSFYSGVELECFRPVFEGDRLTVRGGMAKVEEKLSRMGGRSVRQVRDAVYRNQDGELVAVARRSAIRVERAQARSQGKYMDIEVPKKYSDEELAKIEADYEAEEIRGATPRYWEDVEVGEETKPLVKGPWTITNYICYCEATGPRNNFHRSHSDAYRYRKDHPKAWPRTDYGLPDTVARVHWEPEMARQAGLPHVYDFGGERVAMMSHFTTNWAGDDGWVRRLAVEFRGFFFYGDTMWIRGRVTDKRIEDGEHIVEMDIWGQNQRGDITTPGTATFILPSRENGPVKIPARIPENLSVFE